MTGIICVGLGGGLGAALRYGISLLPYPCDKRTGGSGDRGDRRYGCEKEPVPEPGAFSQDRGVRRFYYIFNVFPGSVYPDRKRTLWNGGCIYVRQRHSLPDRRYGRNVCVRAYLTLLIKGQDIPDKNFLRNFYIKTCSGKS